MEYTWSSRGVGGIDFDRALEVFKRVCENRRGIADFEGCARPNTGVPVMKAVPQGLNRLRKKVEQEAKTIPSAAKAARICNHLWTV